MSVENVGIVFTAKDASWDSGFKRAAKSVQRFSKNVDANFAQVKKNMASLAVEANKLGEGIKNSFSGIKTAIAAIGGTVALAKPVAEAKKFELQLANVNTLLDGTGVSIERYRDQLLTLAKESPKTLGDLSAALYQTISAGIPAIEGAGGAFDVLTQAQKAAVAGLSTTEEAVNAFATVLNAYGAENVSAAEAGDKLLKVVQSGRATFPELASNLGSVSTVAAKAGVSIDELSSLFITLTRSGLSVPAAATGIRALISQIQKPGKETVELVNELNKTLDENSKIQLGAKALREVGFTGVLKSLTVATGGSSEALAQLFPNVRALTPALIAVGKGFDDFKRFTAESVDSVGTLDGAFQKVDGTFSNTFEKFKSTVNATLVNAGNTVLPNLNKRFQELINYVDANGDKFVKTFESFATAIISLGEFFLKYGDVILKVVGSLFAGKAVGLFARSIAALGPVLIAFRNTAVSVFSTVTGSANAAASAAQAAATTTASAGATAATGFGAKLGDGLKKLGKSAGMIGLAIGIGTALAEAAGTAFGNLINEMSGRGEKELDRLLKESQSRVQQIRQYGADVGGFASPEEQTQLEGAVTTGRKIELVPGFGTAQKDDLRAAVDNLIDDAQLIAEEKAAQGVTLSFLRGEIQLPAIDMTKAVDYEKVMDLFDRVRSEAGDIAGKQIAVAGSLIDSDATNKDIETLKSLAKEAKNIEDLQKLAAKAGPGVQAVLDSVKAQVEVSDAAVAAVRERAQIEADIISQATASRKAQIVDLNKFISDQTKQRIARGVSEEEAAAQARLVAETVLQNNIIDAEQDRLDLEKEIAGYQSDFAKISEKILEIKQNFGISDTERNKRLAEAVEQQRTLNVYIEGATTRLQQGVKERIRNLNLIKSELKLEDDINAQRKKNIERQLEQQRAAKKNADAQKRRDKAAKAYRKVLAEREKFAKIQRDLEVSALKTEVGKLKAKEAQANLDATDLQIARQALEANDGILTNSAKIAENIKAQKINSDLLLTVREKIAAAEERAAISAAKAASVEAVKEAEKSGKFVGEGGTAAKRREDAERKRAKVVGEIERQTQEKISGIETERAQKVQQATSANAQTRLQLEAELSNLEKSRGELAKKNADEAAKKAKEGLEKAAKAFMDGISGIDGATEDFEKIVELTGVNAEKYAASLQAQFQYMEDIDGLFGASVDDKISGLLQAMRGIAELDNLLGLDETSVADLIFAYQSGGDNVGLSILNAAKAIGPIFAEALGEFGNSFLDGFGAALAEGAQQFAASVIGLDFEGAASAISDQITGAFRHSARWFDAMGDSLSSVIQGGLKAGFGRGGEIFGKGLSIVFDGFFSSFAALLDGAAAVFEKIVGPVFGALQRPIDAIFGGFESALDSIFQSGKSEEKTRKEQERLAKERAKFAEERADLVAENEAQLRAMRDAGASNEEIARAQAALTKNLETFDEGDPSKTKEKEKKSPEEMIQNAFDKAMDFVQLLIEKLPGMVGQFLTTLAERLPELISGLITALADTLVVVANNFGDILIGVLNGLFEGLPKLIDGLIQAVPKLIQGVLRAATLLLQQLPTIVGELIRFIIEVIPELVQVVVDEVPKLIIAVVRMIPEVIDKIVQAIPVLIETIIDAIPVIIEGVIEALPELVQALIEAIPQIVVSLVKATPQIIWALVKAAPQVIWEMVKAVPLVIGALLEGIAKAFASGFGWIAESFGYIRDFFRALPGYLSTAFSFLWDGFSYVIDLFYQPIMYLGDMLSNIFGWINDSLTWLFNGVGDFLYSSISSAFSWIVDGFRSVIDWFSNIVGFFRDSVGWLSDIFSWFYDAFASFFSGVGDAAGGLWEGVKTVFGKGWLWHDGGMVEGKHRGITSAKMLQALGAPQFANGGMVMSSPADALRQAALNLPMIKDDVPAILQAGEAVLNRDATSRLGADMINALNSGASLGQPVNVNVGITPNEGGLGGIVAALLPMLMGAIDISVASGNRVERSTKLLGYRPIKGA